jgi:hypothetical protein
LYSFREKKKMKKYIIYAVVLSLILPIGISQASAWIVINYPWVKFLNTGSGLHIAQDPLFLASDIGTNVFYPDPGAADYVKGWVTFTCFTNGQAPKGFDYTVTVKGIDRGRYEVYATFNAGPPVFLGILRVGGRGEGELQGFYDLDPGDYEVQVTVELEGNQLQLHLEDLVHFSVFSEP